MVNISEHIDKVVGAFDPVDLKGLDQVKLQDRSDTKYVFNEAVLPDLLAAVKDKYYVLEIDGCRKMEYKTLYYDTEDFSLFTQHHNGKLNRYKVRSRSYMNTGKSFFEIKFKDNKARTIKTRKGVEQIEKKLINGHQKFVQEHAPLDPETLEAKLWVFYRRVTLASRDFSERVTIDLDLRFDNDQKQYDLDGVVIAEVKQDKLSNNSLIGKWLRKNKILPMGMSKYCMGITATYDNIKHNNFKPKWRKIEKIQYST